MRKDMLTSLIKMEDEDKAILELRSSSDLIEFIKESKKESLNLLLLLLKKKQKFKLSKEIISINPNLTICDPDDFGWYLASINVKEDILDFEEISREFICCDLNPSYTILCWQLRSEFFAHLISRNRLDEIKKLAEIGFDFPSFEKKSEASIVALVSICTGCSIEQKKEIVYFFHSLGCELISNSNFKRNVVEDLVSKDEYWYPSLLVELGYKATDFAIDAIKGMSLSKISANSKLYEEVVQNLDEKTISYRSEEGFGIVTELISKGIYALPVKLVKDKRCSELINSDIENLSKVVSECESQDLIDLLNLKRDKVISPNLNQLLHWAKNNYPQHFDGSSIQHSENFGFYEVLSTCGLVVDEEQGLAPESYLSDLVGLCFSLVPEEVTGIQVHSDDNWNSAQVSLSLDSKLDEFVIPNIGKSDWIPESFWESIESFSLRALRFRFHTIKSSEFRLVFYLPTSEFERLQEIVEKESRHM